MYYKIVRIGENGTYHPLFIVCNNHYKPGIKYIRNPAWGGPFAAFRTQADAEAFASDVMDWAIFECEGIESKDIELYWATPNCVFRDQGVPHHGGELWHPKGNVCLDEFTLLRKVAERKV